MFSAARCRLRICSALGSGVRNRRSSVLGSCRNLARGSLAGLGSNGMHDRLRAQRLVLAPDGLQFEFSEKLLLGELGLDHGIERIGISTA